MCPAYSCSFPPEELEFALRAQMHRESFRVRNNEVVVDLRSIVDHLPDSVIAFFYPVGAGAAERALVREQRAKFAMSYRLDSDSAPPLLELDLAADAPFRFAP